MADRSGGPPFPARPVANLLPENSESVPPVIVTRFHRVGDHLGPVVGRYATTENSRNSTRAADTTLLMRAPRC
jgi:hypothetical protein